MFTPKAEMIGVCGGMRRDPAGWFVRTAALRLDSEV